MMFHLQELQIELAGICNVACEYCTWQKRQIGRQLMDRELAFSLLEQAAEMDPQPLVTFHAVGEATLHPDLPALLLLAQKYGISARLSTNCTLLTGDLAEWLSDLTNLNLTLALHQGLPQKTKDKCAGHAQDYLALKPRNFLVEILVVCGLSSQPFVDSVVERFLPLCERLPQARMHFKQPQTWPQSEPIKGHVPALPWHPSITLDTVPTPRSLGRGCTMPEYLLQVLADGTTAACCVGQESWGLPKATERKIEDIWNSAEMTLVRERWRAASDQQLCGHCLKRTDC